MKVRRQLTIVAEKGTSIAEAAHDAVACRQTKKYYDINISFDGIVVKVGLFDKVEQIVRRYHETVGRTGEKAAVKRLSKSRRQIALTEQKER